MTAALEPSIGTTRRHAYVLPAVKEFTTRVQMDLKPMHFRRRCSPLGLSYEYASYLLHVYAGYLPARPIDEVALSDLARVLAHGRAAPAA